MSTDGATVSELSERECWARLRAEPYGRLAVVGPDGPVIYPVNALVDHGSIVFQTAEGSKLTALRADQRVSFEVDGWEPANSLAWSVIVMGTASEITGMHEGLAATNLGVTPWQAGPKPCFVRISPKSIAGRAFRRISPAESPE